MFSIGDVRCPFVVVVVFRSLFVLVVHRANGHDFHPNGIKFGHTTG